MLRSNFNAGSTVTLPERHASDPADLSRDVGHWALEWVRSEVRAFLFTNESLDLLWANAAAHALLDRGTLIRILEGKLAMECRDRQASFVDLVRSCDRDGRFCHFPVPGTEGFAILRAQLIETGAGGRIVALSIRGQGGAERLRYADLKSVFGLSSGEYLVLTALLEGRKPEEISELRDVSVETVRTQIRSIYAKTGVTSRESLFAALRHFMA
jgi:DNA-binding CsgD family transcriptional regulator